MLYKTKPFSIEAVQYTGENLKQLRKEFPEADLETKDHNLCVWDYLQKTWVGINIGDYIIKGMKGEFYPCDPVVFETKYEVDDGL